MKKLAIGIIGCGKLGLPCGEVIASKNIRVEGYDIKPIASELIQKATNIKQVICNKDIIFIAVPTPHEEQYGGDRPAKHLPPKDFNYSAICSVLKEINKNIQKKQMVVLISTVLPGTIRVKFNKLLPNNELIYNPYLIAMGTVRHDMVAPECLIIGTQNGKKTTGVKKLIRLYQQILINKPPIHVGTWEEAECIKIFYNTFISFKISFVNMILDVAQKIGNINVDTVTNAIKKSTKRLISPAYLTAGMGDGGACHPRDNIALRYLAKKINLGYDLFQGIVSSRDQQAKNFAIFIEQNAKKYRLPIVMYGKTYKPGVPLCDGSYSLLVSSYFKQKATYVDPLVNCKLLKNSPSLFVLCHPYDSKHKYCSIPEHSVVIDPWRTFKTTKKITVIQYGNTRLGQSQ